jgi:23S rRNA (adenine2503-C2)-methyltransferase
MIEELVVKYQLPKFRIKQFYQKFYKELIENFDELTTFPKDLRQKLSQEVSFSSLKEVTGLISKDGSTHKILFERVSDGQKIETVLMRHKNDRNTVCVSCMVGCPVNCSFCATGKMGFGGNLTAQEIIDQILFFGRLLKKEDKKVTNVVFMGMGEPMLNFDNVVEAIDILTSPDKLAMSSRRITISTSGYAHQLQNLIQKGFRGKIAISLHAPNQELREKLMPVAKIFSLDSLFEVLDDYVGLTNKKITYEYILIKNVTDTESLAHELGELLQDRLAFVNLIPFNPIQGADFVRSRREDVYNFQNILSDYGVENAVRKNMGDDVNAACGQLADSSNTTHKDKKIFGNL